MMALNSNVTTPLTGVNEPERRGSLRSLLTSSACSFRLGIVSDEVDKNVVEKDSDEMQVISRRRKIFPTLYNEPVGTKAEPATTTTTTLNDTIAPSVEKQQAPPDNTFSTLSPVRRQEDKLEFGRVNSLLVLSPLRLWTDGSNKSPPSSVRGAGTPASEPHKAKKIQVRSLPRQQIRKMELTEMENEDESCCDDNNRPRESVACRRAIITPSASAQTRRITTLEAPFEEPNVKQKRVPLVSILRTKSTPSRTLLRKVTDSPSESSVPSLVSLKDDEDSSVQSCGDNSNDVEGSKKATRRKISFDPRIWVREFERKREEYEVSWFSAEELDEFKLRAISLIRASSAPEIIPTGTGRFFIRKKEPVSTPSTKAFFTHAALGLDAEDCDDDTMHDCRQKYNENDVLECEIRSILIVDPHDICLRLFSRALKTLLPNVEVVTAQTGEDAIRHVSANDERGFDIILIEEQLKVRHSATAQKTRYQSGSALLEALSLTLSVIQERVPLFIGVSARLGADKAKLESSGADLCWGKPPPLMNNALRDDLLKTLLLKRGKADCASELFGS